MSHTQTDNQERADVVAWLLEAVDEAAEEIVSGHHDHDCWVARKALLALGTALERRLTRGEHKETNDGK